MRKRRHKIEQEDTKQQQQQQRETREERSYKMAATTKRYYAYKRSYKKGRSRNAPTTKEQFGQRFDRGAELCLMRSRLICFSAAAATATAGHTLRLNDSTRPPSPSLRRRRATQQKQIRKSVSFIFIYMCLCLCLCVHFDFFFLPPSSKLSLVEEHMHRRGEREAEQLPPLVPLDRPYRVLTYCCVNNGRHWNA